MKFLLQIAFIMLCLSVQAQGWRDTLNMARNAYKQEDYGKALEYYEKVQKTAPESLDLSDEMGQSAYKLREFEKAEKIYQQGGGSKQSAEAKADNYHNLGNARMKQKNYQGAIDAYKDALRIRPNDDETRYNLSEAIRKLKDQQNKGQGGNQDNQDEQNNDPNQNNDEQGNDNSAQNNNSNGQNSPQNQNSPENGNGKPGNGKPSPSSGTLPNNTVERMLDDLTKAEAETKRKISGNKGRSNSPKSGKDW